MAKSNRGAPAEEHGAVKYDCRETASASNVMPNLVAAVRVEIGGVSDDYTQWLCEAPVCMGGRAPELGPPSASFGKSQGPEGSNDCCREHP